MKKKCKRNRIYIFFSKPYSGSGDIEIKKSVIAIVFIFSFRNRTLDPELNIEMKKKCNRNRIYICTYLEYLGTIRILGMFSCF